jgi:hypothetical protein
MWVVIKHFEKCPTLFSQQLIGANVLPQNRPESYIDFCRGYSLGMGGKLCSLLGVCKKERKNSISIIDLQLPDQK